jgi:small subunit ribosomal protein S4e
MVRGPKKHLKRINAPSSWMLDKLGGTWAPKPSSGPHKSREALPLAVLLKNKLKYAMTQQEVLMIVKDRKGLVKVDGRVRSDHKFPTGFMDVVSLESAGEYFRLLFDIKGRFTLVRIDAAEAAFKLCKIRKRLVAVNGVPYVVTHDGRTLRYPHPDINAADTVKLNLKSGEIVEHIKLEPGNLAIITGGRNTGRVGQVSHREVHQGGFDILHLKDSKGHAFATRLSNAFIIGKGKHSLVTLPKREGVRLNIIEEQTERHLES